MDFSELFKIEVIISGNRSGPFRLYDDVSNCRKGIHSCFIICTTTFTPNSTTHEFALQTCTAMSVSAIAPRRKAATYGRASRKPLILAGNTFATAVETDMWNVRSNLEDWKQSSVPTNRQRVRAANSHVECESSDRSPTSEPTTSNEQGCLSNSTATHAAKDGSLYDITSSEDENRQGICNLVLGSRKRRRISPEPVAVSGPFVYDDASLQSYVAAECQKALLQDNSCSITHTIEHKARPAHIVGGNEGKQKRGSSEMQGENLKARKPCKQYVPMVDCGFETPDKASKEGLKGHPNFRSRPNVTRISKTPSRKAKNHFESVPKDVAKSLTPGSRSIIPQLVAPPSNHSLLEEGDRKRPLASTECFRSPKTPPRTIKNTEVTTTPRQRELWNKLLDEEFQTASPSNLDLPGLTVSDNKSASRTVATAHKPNGKPTRDPTARPRRKIVDTLHPRNCDDTFTKDDSNQDSDNACNDSLSNSTKSKISAIDRAIAVQTYPSADSQSRVKQHDNRTLSNTSQPVPSLHGAGLKVTYARQRSYLTDRDLDEASMLQTPIVPELVSTQGGFQRGIGHSISKSHSMRSLQEEFGDSQDTQGGAMRSVHELREAGGNVRLVSELEAMLDDIEEEQPASGTLRRTRLLDLVTKLQEPSTCRLFIDRALETRLLAYVGVESDLITNSLLAAAILGLIAGPTSTLLLAQISNARIVNFLISLLDLDQDLALQAKSRGYNLSKYAQQEYNKMCTSVVQSAAWRAGEPPVLSCHLLALQCLEYLVRQTRECGSLSLTLPAYAIRRIVACSIPPPSIPLPQLTPMSTVKVELAVSILESCTISNAAECQESVWEGDTLQRVMSLLPLLMSCREDECGSSRTLTLRLYCNLTNNSPGLCEGFSTSDIVEALFEIIIASFEQISNHAVMQQTSTLSDDMILSLGVFVNLAETSSIVRQMVMDLLHGPQSYLHVLLELFMTKSKNAAEVRCLLALVSNILTTLFQVFSEKETNLNVAVGYLSVLLGFLCLNKYVKAWVSAQLHGGTLKHLVDALEEFLQYYRQVGQEVHRDEIEGDPKTGYVGRLQGLVEDLKN